MSPRTTRIAGWILALVVIATCCALGSWQLTRMQDKRAMLDAVGQVLEQREVRPLATAHRPDRARDYDWAAGGGRFIDTPAFVLDNQIHDGRPGLRVYRVFQPEAGAALLVDLGWTPLVDRAARMPADDVVGGDGLLGHTLEVRGLLAPPPSPGLALGPALGDGDTRLMTRFDAEAIAVAAGLQTPPLRVLRLDPALEIGYARDLDILPNTLSPEKHLGYAVQWFGLALAALITALILTFRRSRR